MESMAVLDWVFPGETVTLQDLPETTSLQKKMKLFLLNGGKIGRVKGKYKKKITNKNASVLLAFLPAQSISHQPNR